MIEVTILFVGKRKALPLGCVLTCVKTKGKGFSVRTKFGSFTPSTKSSSTRDLEGLWRGLGCMGLPRAANTTVEDWLPGCGCVSH